MTPAINTIHPGDCLEVLKTWPDKCVDIVVTSPPYNTLGRIHGSSGMHRGNKWVQKAKKGKSYDDDMPEPQYQDWLSSIITECLRVSKGTVWVNHKARHRDGLAIHPLHFLRFPLFSEIIWDRRCSMALNCKRFAPSHEVILGFGKPHFWDSSLDGKMTVWPVTPRPQNIDHPCPFPVELVAPLIASSCPRGGVVLDPFFGSGSTGVAAVRTDRQWVGIEMVPAYIKTAEARIASETAQGRLF